MNREKFLACFQSLIDKGLINKYMITKSVASNKGNLHSKLIYAFMNSFEDKCTALPEIKIRFSEPINNIVTSRKQFSYKTDVAIYERNLLKGICEVFTLDMCANYMTKAERDKIHSIDHFTSADKIIHLFDKSPSDFKIDFYLIGVLPKKIEQKPSYADVRELLKGKTDMFNFLKPQIDKLFTRIKGNVLNCNSIVVTEEGIYFDNDFEKIDFP